MRERDGQILPDLGRDNMKWFILSVGEILISKIDIPVVQNGFWKISKGGYIEGTGGKYKGQFLHKIIAERAGLDLSNEIDHKDGNPLNNQRGNLRSATKSQNAMNRKSNNKLGFKGVTYSKAAQRWQAQIQANGKKRYLGSFDTPEEAHEAYCEAANEHFGEFARHE